MAREINGRAVSDLAVPPVSGEEMKDAGVAICRGHHGRIADHLAQGDEYGKAYYCPIGGMYWRLTRETSGLMKPLSWPRNM